MSSVDRDHIVQAFAPDGSNQPFAESVRLGCSDWRPQHINAEIFERNIDRPREDRVTVMDHKSKRMRFDKNFGELLSGPLGDRMFREIAMQDPARADLHRDEDVKYSESRGDAHEEIAGDDRLGVVPNERGPTLIPSSTSRPFWLEILRHGSRRNLDPSFSLSSSAIRSIGIA